MDTPTHSATTEETGRGGAFLTKLCREAVSEPLISQLPADNIWMMVWKFLK
ncbi:hypothetical protein DPMN_001679 [Dreissena polymorpha]|uniref:Uncharacterized protein n=1 Tax=Dreissena polymorpha TaxID=45954 RepID=A0A9D4RQJ4_DREPO|nr:hypothetical protein DPMN_001679 [Dreissena polymorpha]